MSSPQLTRQWTVLRELTASRRGRTLKQLAREADVHERTVRRDIYALMDAGFPIEKIDGEESVRFRFHPEHKLPELPLDFTEALALYHATTTSPLFENPLYHLRLEKALYKIQEAFPAEVKGYIGNFRQAYTHRQPVPRDNDMADICNILQKQITFSYRIRFAYTNLKGVASERTVDPYFIHIHEGEFYLLGYCHLRQDYRIFRIDCIRDLQALEEDFSIAPDFDPYQLLQTSLGVHLGEPGIATLLFEGVAARYFQRSPLHPRQKILEESEGRLLLEVPFRGFNEVTEIVLKYGAEAEVISPPELRDHVLDQVQKTLARYQTDLS